MLAKRFVPDMEKKWQEQWKQDGIYRFDLSSSKPVYSMDTPPPFTSGSLHMGHVYNHTWIDIIARYKRMTGHSVLLPQGFDCHGLPTELAVEKKMGIKKQDREAFIRACTEWTEKAVARMKEQFNSLGYSTDWEHSYRTMDDAYKKRVQKSLLMFYEKGKLFREKHPILWCWKCGTALAKAEVGYVEMPGKLYYIDLDVTGGHKITIATTRPEMMPACVAVIVHPEDPRYKSFIGKEAIMPIFNQSVPIIADEDVDMDFGTGVVYLCTFGDEQDIRWQKKYKLPVIEAIQPNGRMSGFAGKFKDMRMVEARKAVTEELAIMGKIRKVEDYQHNVLCHTERGSCNNPIELLPMKQWFIRVKDSLDEIKRAARGMNWYPGYMLGRLEDWTESMDWDWIISRQRVFGTPIPFWTCECGKVIAASVEDLPVDPRESVEKCPKCGGDAMGERDVCDCWVDSSVSPLAVSKWGEDEEFFGKVYPASLRPQGYEIIRTWTFYTIFRNLVLTGKPCFMDLMINGMVGGPDGKKMSKSLGNVIEPEDVLKKYPADAIRQWAATGSLGEDFPFSWDECEHSAKFLTKLWNVSRFISSHLEDYDGQKPELRITDKWILSKLQKVTESANTNFEKYVFNLPVQEIRSFIWHDLADYYLEMVKYRLYKPEVYGEESRKAAQYTLNHILEVILKLIAPVTPHISEELYGELFKKGSVHLEDYPQKNAKLLDEEAEKAGEALIEIIDAVRKYKSDNNLSLGADLEKVVIETPQAETVKGLETDIKGTGRIANLEINAGKELKLSF
jgi:valyl-tRNA synthetase